MAAAPPPPVQGRQLWAPKNPDQTQMSRFRRHVAHKYRVDLPDYEALHAWSVENIDDFWAEVWHLEGNEVVASEKWTQIIDTSASMSSIPAWFTGAKLNWAENMLKQATLTPDKVALVECSEPPIGQNMTYRRTTFGELKAQVQSVAASLRASDLKPNSILCYYGPTSSASVILLLACSSIGAIWSSAAADFGPNGVLERFEQFVTPDAHFWGIVGVESVRYNGKTLDQRGKFDAVVEGIERKRAEVGAGGDSLNVVLVDYLREGKMQPMTKEGWSTWDDFVRTGEEKNEPLEFYQAPFDHPLWCLFSSGTTGKPKPIVHRAGGMLLQSAKEHVLHGDMDSTSVHFYYTTPGWMMYNYLVSSLQTGAAIVLFDGSPLFRPEILWQMVDDLGVTTFGTSAKYLDVLSKTYSSPKSHHSLSTLQQVLSTGSPLKPELFVWVYEHIKSDIMLGSITGGTDICSLFAGHNAALPVYEGEIQCICLGMAIESWSEDGRKLPKGEQGDLVCVKSFPCMPCFFWGDTDGSRYQASYFDKFPGVWQHGDFCIITPSREGNGGGLLMLGRSDGVLNPSGIRFGSSEIYEVIDTFAPSAASAKPDSNINIIEDSLVVGQKIEADERVVLFCKLVEGQSELSDALLKEIKMRIRTARSARHVPERIVVVKDIPHTVNGKKVEVPIKKLLAGAPLASINASTLRNPECLVEYVELGQMLRKEVGL